MLYYLLLIEAFVIGLPLLRELRGVDELVAQEEAGRPGDGVSATTLTRMAHGAGPAPGCRQLGGAFGMGVQRPGCGIAALYRDCEWR
jgi:hypothetical protein